MTDRALLVGIDQYPDPINSLNSCVADTLAFKGMLDATFGIGSDSVRLLHNSAATLSAVRAGLDWLFEGAQPGDPASSSSPRTATAISRATRWSRSCACTTSSSRTPS
ncbi:MAG: hypothetical protein QOJ07_1536 [Thermoleophilaceae bacterium]|nr:hypothetical protein [Thermoleophilaceae bacterium]